MDYENYVKTKLSDHPNRLKHTLGVYKRAIELGVLYNADLEVLKTASLLHDITKHESDEYHKKTINDLNILLKYPKPMWHAFSAAKLAENLNIKNKKIIEAIKYHVFGKIDMNLETMILCVSDFSEENRTFKAAKEVHLLAQSNLTDAYLLAVKSTIDYLKKNKIEPITEQIETYLYYKERKR